MFETNGYLGFTFAEHHSSEFGLLVASDGSRYHQNLYNRFSDDIVNTPGKNGGYFFGTQISQRDFDINCVFDELTSHEMHKIQHWLYPNKIGWLIFDEYPYKRYLVKLSTIPSFNFIPFDQFKKTTDYNFQKEILKGEVKFSFVCLNEYAERNPKYELSIIDKENLITQQDLDSGILPKNYQRKYIYLSNEKIENLAAYQSFSLYNAGNGVSEANLKISVSTHNFPIKIFNYNDGVTYKIFDPSEIFEQKKISIDDIVSYNIFINSENKEIYAQGLLNNNEYTENINIGACYNHYFPKIYHTKPTEFCIFSQSVDSESIDSKPEPILYTFSYSSEDFNSSDEKLPTHSFEEFQQYWSDYTILTRYNTFQVNNILSPATIFVEMLEKYNKNTISNELGYLIYPNKYVCNQNLNSITAIYKDTYI